MKKTFTLTIGRRPLPETGPVLVGDSQRMKGTFAFEDIADEARIMADAMIA
jgi:hypothetical protein